MNTFVYFVSLQMDNNSRIIKSMNKQILQYYTGLATAEALTRRLKGFLALLFNPSNFRTAF